MSSSNNNNERIAILETEIKQLHEQQKELFNILKKHMEEEDQRWKLVLQFMNRQKGFIGGAVFIVSSMWAVLGAAIHFLGNK